MNPIYKFTDYTNNRQAIMSRYNAYIRVLAGDNKEYFFYSHNKAIMFLLNQGYSIHLDI